MGDWVIYGVGGGFALEAFRAVLAGAAGVCAEREERRIKPVVVNSTFCQLKIVVRL
jgi:hypothetical protein